MTKTRDIDKLQRHLPKFMELLGGELVALDHDSMSSEFSFAISTDYCHSGDVVQGGFITAMLDAAMSHAVFACDDSVINISSLEISTRYLAVARAGSFRVTGRVVRLAYKTAFLDSELRSTDGTLLATAQSVAKVVRRKEKSEP
ncbi:MAG: PaaI family thioesterase [Pseudomonadota bacterium]